MKNTKHHSNTYAHCANENDVAPTADTPDPRLVAMIRKQGWWCQNLRGEIGRDDDGKAPHTRRHLTVLRARALGKETDLVPG